MRLLTKMQTKNAAYIRNRKCTPVGILVHSTAANNPYCSRYVDYVEELGPNKYGNHWNKPTANKAMHAFIGYSKDKRDVVAVETLPYNVACMGAGGYPLTYNPDGTPKTYRSANYDPQAHIQFEVCEDGTTDPVYYKQAWEVAEEYCAYLCKKFGWSSKNITSHYEGYKAKMANNHGDPRHWMVKHNDSMDKFRARVQARLNAPVAPDETWNTINIKITKEENATRLKCKVGDTIKLPLETYLLGVVPAELGTKLLEDGVLEAAKAQAIAARTVAYSRTRKGAAITDDSTVDQAYYTEYAELAKFKNAHQAVYNTIGEMLYYKNSLVESAVFSHSNGGQVRSPKEAGWPGTQAYLVSKPDPYTKEEKKGHGVGLSQMGAIEMAKQGKSYTDILKFYYEGTEVLKIDYLIATGQASTNTPVDKPSTFTPYLAEVITKNPNSLGIWNDTNKSKRNAYVPRGEILTVTGEVDATWAKVEFNQIKGYADRQYLKKVVITPAPEKPSTDVVVLYKAQVNTKNPLSLNIWADTKKTKSLALIPRGTTVDVLSVVDSTWAQVRHNGVVGYSDKQYLVPDGTITESTSGLYSAVVATRYPLSLNVWTNTNKGKSLALIPNGTEIVVLEEVSKQWARVRYGNVEGYSDRAYLQKK